MTQPPFPGNDFFDQIDSVARNLTGNAYRLKRDDPDAPGKFTEFIAQSEQEFNATQPQAAPQSFRDFEQGGFVPPEVAEARLQDPDWAASQAQAPFQFGALQETPPSASAFTPGLTGIGADFLPYLGIFEPYGLIGEQIGRSVARDVFDAGPGVTNIAGLGGAVLADPASLAGIGRLGLKAGPPIAKGTSAALRQAGQSAEQAAAAIGRTGVGNVLDPVPPQTVAGRAAGGAEDVEPKFHTIHDEGVRARTRSERIADIAFGRQKKNYSEDIEIFADRIFREQSPEEARGALLGGDFTPFAAIPTANTPNLALGQGTNKGVLIEYTTEGLKGRPDLHSKPGLRFVAQESGEVELEIRNISNSELGRRAVSATIDPKVADKRELRLLQRALKNSGRFDREVLPDGKIRYTPKQAVEEADAAPRGAGGEPRVTFTPNSAMKPRTASPAERATLERLGRKYEPPKSYTASFRVIGEKGVENRIFHGTSLEYDPTDIELRGDGIWLTDNKKFADRMATLGPSSAVMRDLEEAGLGLSKPRTVEYRIKDGATIHVVEYWDGTNRTGIPEPHASKMENTLEDIVEAAGDADVIAMRRVRDILGSENAVYYLVRNPDVLVPAQPPTTPARQADAAARGAGDAISSGRLFQSGFGATYLDDFEKGMRTVPLPQGVSESDRLTGQQFVAAMRKTPRELSDLELASVYEEAGRIANDPMQGAIGEQVLSRLNPVISERVASGNLARAEGTSILRGYRLTEKSTKTVGATRQPTATARGAGGERVVREHSSPSDLHEAVQIRGRLDPGIHVAGENVYRVGADGVPVRDPSVDASFNFGGPNKGLGNFSINPTTKNVEEIPAEIAPLIQGTKVVDHTGKPLRVFHGTPHEFDEFVANTGTNYGVNSIEGIYFDPRRSGAFGQGLDPNTRIVEAYVNLQNPSIGTRNLTREELIAKGHDGVINVDADGEIWEVIAFDNSTIHQVSPTTPARQADAAPRVTPEQQAIIDDVGTGRPAGEIPVADGRAGGSGPPNMANRPTLDAGEPEGSRSALFQPAPTLPAKDDPIVQRAYKAIRDTKPATEESLAALSKGRQRQIARGGRLARQAETFAEVGTAVQRGIAGEIPRPEFESIAPLFSPEDIESLLSRIWGRGSVLEFANEPPGFINWRKFNADVAFKKLFHPDSAVLPTPSELELLERVYGPEIVRAVLSKKKLGDKAWDYFLDAWNLPRSLLSTADISSTLRQAGMLGPGNPKQFKDAFKDQLKAFANEEYALAARNKMEADPDFLRFTTKSGRMEEVGVRKGQRLQITVLGEAGERARREEMFMTSLAGRLPIVRASERAYVTMLNELRFSVMKSMVEVAELTTGKAATDAQLDAIAEFINYATGRGSLWKAEGAAPLLNGLGFSPRLAVSRFQVPLTVLRRAPGVRKQVASNLVKYAGLGAMVLFLLDHTPGVDVVANPNSSDYGKIRIGKTRFDLFAGNLQMVRFLSQLVSGKKQAIGTRSESAANRADIVTRYLRTKAHPSLGFGLDVASEEDFLGEEFRLDPESFTKLDVRRNPVLRQVTPMIIQDIVEAYKESGPLMAVGAGVASTLGVGVSSFSTPEDASQELWGEPITDVWPFQQKLAKDLFARTSERGPGVFDQADINHYEAFQDIVEQLESRNIDKRTAVNRYFSINTFYSGLREGLSAGIFGGDLKEEPVFPKAPSGGTDAEKAALQEYYDSSEPFESPSGFNSDEWGKVLRQLERKWQTEGTLQYVLANTHTRPVPTKLLKLLPSKTRKTIERSSKARAAYLEQLDKEQLATESTQRNLRPAAADNGTLPIGPTEPIFGRGLGGQ